jgi:hypothetical protein
MKWLNLRSANTMIDRHATHIRNIIPCLNHAKKIPKFELSFSSFFITTFELIKLINRFKKTHAKFEVQNYNLADKEITHIL